MSEITKVNPCNKCWKEPDVLGYAARDIVQYHCCGDTGWMTYAAWQSANPLTEKPAIDAGVISDAPKAEPETLPKCWCGVEWELTESEISYEHPSTECDLSGIRFFKNQIRFLFNPEIIKKLVSERDDLQAKLDAIPSERFTSPVAYENLARRYALACRIIRAFTDIVLEHDD